MYLRTHFVQFRKAWDKKQSALFYHAAHCEQISMLHHLVDWQHYQQVIAFKKKYIYTYTNSQVCHNSYESSGF